jgi:hypothetical protein
MARGAKTRFLDDAIENGVNSAVAKFPQAFNADEVAALTELPEPQRRQELQVRLKQSQEIDEAFRG